jgi:hypothetical protein
MPKLIHCRSSDASASGRYCCDCNIAVLQGALSARLSGILPPILCLFTTTNKTREPASIPAWSLPMSRPTLPRTATAESKRMAASCHTGDASFIATVSKPPRPRLCVALRPISSCGRGASDTVLSNIGSHVNITSTPYRHQARIQVFRCSGVCGRLLKFAAEYDRTTTENQKTAEH